MRQEVRQEVRRRYTVTALQRDNVTARQRDTATLQRDTTTARHRDRETVYFFEINFFKLLL